jgi:type III restriction enzyme
VEENVFINQVRDRVKLWREGGYKHVTKTTARLLEHWNSTDRSRRLFFCQIEALETAIYVLEVAKKAGDAWIENDLQKFNQAANPLLDRVALKMATGSGKTVVMAMLIAWQSLNKLANPQDARYSDSFLVVTPGITIRDRLRVLLPNDPNDYFRGLDIVPSHQLDQLQQAKIVITNYHAFQLRERVAAGKLTKQILTRDGTSPFTETPDQMARRVCRELGNKRGIVVLNDESHHCYRRKPDAPDADEPLVGDDRKEAEKRNEEARVWITGLEAIKQKIGVKTVYDLSATPFFLKGSGNPEGTLFPWVVSDFSLIDAIEAGIVKVPRVPVADDSMTGEQPTYRDLWSNIREALPKKGRKTDKLDGPPQLPAKLEGAIRSLYQHYEKDYQRWEQNADARAKGLTPPVFIVVCNNTSVSKLVFDFIAGWEKELPNGEKVLVPGQLPIFSNVDRDRWKSRPNTILVDSEQLESGEAMSDDFKKIAAAEIEEFKADYRARFPGRDTDDLKDEDLLREVMNTVGKPGKLGENVKCVVSVSMLTEGWDANTVTHILGVRAFGTQLLCEQVVGRGLRRMSYSVNDEGKFDPEYAEVYGVPFSFIPCSGAGPDVKPGPMPTRVRSLENRIDCEITFPRLLGYRYDIEEAELQYEFTADSKLSLSTRDLPLKTENAPIVGQSSIHNLDELRGHRPQEVAFKLAKLTLEKYFRGDCEERTGATKTEKGKDHKWDHEVQAWRFPQLLDIAKSWLAECVTCKGNTFPQLLLLTEFAHDASDRIYQAIVRSDGCNGQTRILRPILQPYDTLGSTRWVDFDTTRSVYATNTSKCHISHVVCDTDSWEQKLAQTLEDDLPEVVRYVKNHNLGFFIPYNLNGDEKRYIPDFIACIDDGHGPDDLLNLILEVTGERKKDKAAKVSTARTLWIPAVNNEGSFGRWEFLEISDPWDATNTIRAFLQKE